MRFVDLFAGLGGFHLAAAQLGARCVFASEIDPLLRSLYTQNFGLKPSGDIRKVNPKDVPPHDLLCAGHLARSHPRGCGALRLGYAVEVLACHLLAAGRQRDRGRPRGLDLHAPC